MLWILRHLIAIAVLPFSVTVLIPVWLARSNATSLAFGSSLWEIGQQVAGVLLLGLGGVLFVASLRHFIREGRGTLAP